MNSATTALAKRPCMALVRIEPPLFAPWRGRLRQLLALFLARQMHRQIARAYGLLDPGPLDGHELFRERSSVSRSPEMGGNPP